MINKNTQLEKLTKEFQELDRVTPRPLSHEDYAIAAIQFFKGESDRIKLLEYQVEQLQQQRDLMLNEISILRLDNGTN